MPWVAIPAESVTACCSAIPTSKARFGKASIINFIELPLGMAGVIPIILGLFLASSTSVNPKTSWNFGGKCSSDFLIISPVAASNLPGAWYFTWSSSACCKPLPLVVMMCKNFGPFTFLSRSNSLINVGKS